MLPLTFSLNGDIWSVRFVSPASPMLIDRGNRLTLATTDPIGRIVYVSNALHGDILNRVLVHELGHCTMVSYNMLPHIHAMTYPEHWVDMEELVCNAIADYGVQIYRTAYDILGEDAWLYVPRELDRLMA